MKFLALVTMYALAAAKHEKYFGWKTYIVNTTTEEQVIKLVSTGTKLGVDFLTTPNLEEEGLLLVNPKQQEELTRSLNALGIQYRTHADNIKSLLDHDDFLIKEQNKSIALRSDVFMPYDNYQPLDVIYNFMDAIASKFPTTTKLVRNSFSFDRRPIKYMKISNTNFQDEKKPVILIDGGIHAREWIAPPVVTWIIRKLTEGLNERHLLDDQDWILVPVVNPDGYDYTFTQDRYWRKTRSTNTHHNARRCPGVDGNRNFAHFWNTSDTSSDPCSLIYPGNYAFSELETSLLRDILQQYRSRIVMYINLHSFGSMILYPWLHDGSRSRRAHYLHLVGTAMADAIHYHSLHHFPGYRVGNGATILYGASGSGVDYAHSLGIPLAFAFELPGLSESNHGFNLEPRYIKQVCLETWAGIKVGVKQATKLFRKGY
nr:carboxypeptidase B [Helicoverpa armigera]